MSAFSPLATILTQNKLTGNNYVDWKRNLDIVLTTKDHIYVLSTLCSLEPPANAAAAVKREFDKWKKSNGMARCYMLASMVGVLQHQFQLNDSAASIMVASNVCLETMVGLLGKLPYRDSWVPRW